MKKLIFCLIALCGLFSCHSDFDYDEQVKSNAEQILGFNFYNNHDWCTTISGKIKVIINNPEIEEVQLLVSTNTEKIRAVNKAFCNTEVTLNYDIPSSYNFLCVNFIYKNKQNFVKKFDINDKEISLASNSRITRAIVNGFTLPDNPVIYNSEISYARSRGYKGFEKDMLYQLEDESIMEVENYSNDFLEILRAIIFTYLPNGRAYDNLPQIKKSGYYNDKCYAITTGEEPIIVSPVYKNDGGYHEVETADLYYYYFHPDSIIGNEVDYFKSLPKYKAVQLNKSILEDDTLKKHHSYALIYYGDTIPVVGQTIGTYNFPKGYKIGFMVRSKFKDDVKKGELYFDGRLNEKINKHGHFASSRLGPTDPRMCWITVNKKMFMCCEEGTDRDFNDVIFEVEGGIEDIVVPPPFEDNYFTFCFEDQRLGDYDMNDVVLRGSRIDETHVEWALMACGANDKLFIYNVEGKHINKNNEVHSLFNKTPDIFINTVKGYNTEYIVDTVVVNTEFSFLNKANQPYIYDLNRNWYVEISTAGKDPHAIMIPYDFKWPLEKTCITKAYLQFNEWGQNPVTSTKWYEHPEVELIFE